MSKTNNQKKWILKGCKTPHQDIVAMARELEIQVVAAQILAVRGYDNIDAIRKYFDVSINNLHRPELMKDMDKGCEILLQAIKEQKQITIFGDYDADGITSTSILMLCLRRLGAKVNFYIPARETEGYGLNNAAVVNLKKSGTQLLLTSDNGISAYEQVNLAKALGMSVIISDHHEVPFEQNEEGGVEYILPPADAIINPKQADCPYPFKSLCAGAIAYKISQRLYELADKPWYPDGEEYLSLAIVATICDIMDLTDENRTMVKYGLSRINHTPNLGLRALLKVNNLLNKSLGAYHIGFIIGPCINASGRLELADRAVELFLAEDEKEAEERAQYLLELNSNRKDLSNKGVDLVQQSIETQGLGEDKVIVVHQPDLQESIAGIVSGRIKELYYRPTFVFAGDKEQIRGSGRSIEGYNMFEALVECNHLLDLYGGHPMAAGLSLQRTNFEQLRKELNENCKLEPEDMIPVTTIDISMPIERATIGLAHQLAKLEPFGKGNSMPTFGDKDLQISRIQLQGANEQIVKIFFTNRQRRGLIPTIMFRRKEELYDLICSQGGEQLWNDLLEGHGSGCRLDIIYTIELNNYNNNSYLQLQIKDFRLHNPKKQ